MAIENPNSDFFKNNLAQTEQYYRIIRNTFNLHPDSTQAEVEAAINNYWINLLNLPNDANREEIGRARFRYVEKKFNKG